MSACLLFLLDFMYRALQSLIVVVLGEDANRNTKVFPRVPWPGSDLELEIKIF